MTLIKYHNGVTSDKPTARGLTKSNKQLRKNPYTDISKNNQIIQCTWKIFKNGKLWRQNLTYVRYISFFLKVFSQQTMAVLIYNQNREQVL